MTGVILLLCGLVGQWLLGIALASVVLRKVSLGSGLADHQPASDEPTRTEIAGLGIILGIGGTAAILFLWSFCSGPLGRAISFALMAIGSITGGTVIWIARADNQPEANPVVDASTGEDLRERRWCQACQLMIACLFAGVLVQTLMTPQRLWDERASFALKGIVLWEDHSIFSRDLTDPNFVQYHPRYPLLIPLAELHIYELLGNVDDRLSKLIFPLLYLGMVLTITGVLERHFTRGTAWLFGLLTATIPSLVPWEYGFACGQADAPIACFHGISVLYLWLAWRQISSENPVGWFSSALLAGVCGALAAFTKDEGISYLLVDAIAVLMMTAMTSRRGLAVKIFWTVFGIAGTLLVPWFVHRRGLPLTTEANYFGRISLTTILAGRANLEWEIQHLARRMFWEFSTWGLQWWLLVFGVAAAPRRMMTGAQWLLILDLAGSLCSLMLAGMVAVTEVSDHVGGSSHRYLMQLAPVAVLFAAGQLGQFRRQD